MQQSISPVPILLRGLNLLTANQRLKAAVYGMATDGMAVMGRRYTGEGLRLG